MRYYLCHHENHWEKRKSLLQQERGVRRAGLTYENFRLNAQGAEGFVFLQSTGEEAK
jgi:hypothetical protein